MAAVITLNPALLPHTLDELYVELDEQTRIRDAAEAFMDLGAGNYESEFRIADAAMFLIQGRIDELEHREARAEERERRRDYHRAVL